MFVVIGYSDEDFEKKEIEVLLSCCCDVFILYVEVVSDVYLVDLVS